MADRRTGPVAGVILAAGRSTRMGRNKLLLELGGESLVRRAVGAAAAAGLDPVLVVLGHERDQVQAALSGLRCSTVVNADYAQGMSASLRAGFCAVPDEVEGGVALLGDMPFVSSGMIVRLVERFRAGAAPLVVSTYGGVLAPPILYGRALFPELRSLGADGAGRQVVQRHRASAEEIAWPPASLADLDVPDDVERARAVLARPPAKEREGGARAAGEDGRGER